MSHLMIALTSAMARDLRYAVALHQRTVGTYDYPKGALARLRTGHALARRGLVELANRQTANRWRGWRPTAAGMEYVEKNFRAADDPFRTEAAAKATATVTGAQR